MTLVEPQEVLAIYASERQQDKGETVFLKDLVCHDQAVFIIVDTTCPIKKGGSTQPLPGGVIASQMRKEKPIRQPPANIPSKPKLPRKTKPPLEADKTNLPNWLRQELNDAGSKWTDVRNEEKQEPSSRNHARPVTAEHIRRLEREYERKKRELLLEAQNAVRLREEAYNEELVKLTEQLEEYKQLQSELMAAKAQQARYITTFKKKASAAKDSLCLTQ